MNEKGIAVIRVEPDRLSNQSQAQAEIRAIQRLARCEGRPLRQEERNRVDELLESGQLRAELDQLKEEEEH